MQIQDELASINTKISIGKSTVNNCTTAERSIQK